jgi:hypothetical protein
VRPPFSCGNHVIWFSFPENTEPFRTAFLIKPTISPHELAETPIFSPTRLLCTSIPCEGVPRDSMTNVAHRTAHSPSAYATSCLDYARRYASQGPFPPPFRSIVAILHHVTSVIYTDTFFYTPESPKKLWITLEYRLP